MSRLCAKSQHSASVAQIKKPLFLLFGLRLRQRKNSPLGRGKHRVCLYTGPCPAPRQTHLRAVARTHYDGGEK